MLENGMREFVEKLARTPAEQAANDYTKDGILYCGKCNSPKQAWIDWFPDKDGNPQKNLVRIMCECDIAREAEEKTRKEQDDFDDRMRSIRLALHTMRDDVRWRFEMDTDPGNPIAKTCRKYVDEWDRIRAENIGIIFYGTKGSGKTFYASCIYNALKDRYVTVGFSSAPNLMNIMGQWDKTEIFDAIKRAQMLVIDDIGAERDNSYSAELMYSIIDARYKTGKPTIVTTNLDIDDMKTEQDMWRSRIYDRILEMCPIPLKMQGDSRRLTIADERKRIAKELLDWTKKGAAK